MDLYQELFNHFSEEHGITMLQSEMQEVIAIIKKHHALQLRQSQVSRSSGSISKLCPKCGITPAKGSGCINDNECPMK